MMWVEGHNRKWEVEDEAELERVLQFRDVVGGAQFWLGFPSQRYPVLAIRVSGDMADFHYFAHEGHAGFRALSEPTLARGDAVFVYEGSDPASGEKVPGRFVLPSSRVTGVARGFFRTHERPTSVSWLEL